MRGGFAIRWLLSVTEFYRQTTSFQRLKDSNQTIYTVADALGCSINFGISLRDFALDLPLTRQAKRLQLT